MNWYIVIYFKDGKLTTDVAYSDKELAWYQAHYKIEKVSEPITRKFAKLDHAPQGDLGYMG